MAIDGYFLNQQIKEFNPILINAKLRKINGVSKHQIVLSLYNKGKNNYLLLDVSPNTPHFRLVNDILGKHENSFVDNLKRLLLNSTLININQHKMDRTIFITFSKSDPFTGIKNYVLAFEIMGRNTNLILLDENNIILDAFYKRFNEDKRSIIPNILYEPFPTNKKLFEKEDFINLFDGDQIFYNYMGFSKQLANYIFKNKIHPNDLTVNPTLYKGHKIEFHFFDLNLNEEKYTFDNTSSLLEYYYSLTIKSDDFLIKTLNKELKKQQQKLINLTLELKNNKNYNDYKTIADNIYSSGLNLRQKYSEFNNFPLNSQLSLNDNAQKLYQKYKKQKGSLIHLEQQLLLTNNLISYLNDTISIYPTLNFDELEDLKEELTDLAIIKQKKRKIKSTKKTYFQQLNLDGATCLIGKTLKQNEFIYSKAKKDDLWFHVKDYPGAHVILKGNHTEKNILIAAQQALINSSLKNNKSGEVIYTLIKNTKRIKNKPGFYVTYNNENNIKINIK